VCCYSHKHVYCPIGLLIINSAIRNFYEANVLERRDAVAILEDICMNFSGGWINSIVLTRDDDEKSVGYKLQIKGNLNHSVKTKIHEIVQFYCLCIDDHNGLVIYEPKATE
jgi:hypothetical protein